MAYLREEADKAVKKTGEEKGGKKRKETEKRCMIWDKKIF